MHCLVCNQEFEYPDFPCKKKPGNHQVAVKTYYDLGASHLTDFRDRRKYAPQHVLVPSYSVRDEKTGAIIPTRGIMVQFQQSGKYATDDPEAQYYLDKMFPSDEEGLKRWQSVYLTPVQQGAIAKDELANLQRQIKDSNELLAAQKAQRAAPTPVKTSA